ncbi:MAG TPA: endopeptidase La, partial [Clostridia bacterium]|nr:endopeptidase La [Clostridia bacterium]
MFQSLPVIPLRGMVVLPGEIVHCDAGRKKTLAAIQAAASADGVAFFCTQKDANVQEPGVDDLEQTGTICEIKQVFRIQGDGIHMLVTGLSRARVESIISETPYFEASVFELEAAFGDGTTEEALKRRIQEGFAEFARLNGGLTSGQRSATLSIEDAGKFADAVAALVISDAPNRQRLLEETNIQQRLSLLLSLLNKELEISRLDYDIAKRLQAELEKNQKEHFLREKIKVIRKELGEDEQTEADEYYARMKEKQFPEAVAERLKKEIGRLAVLPMGSHETPITRNYIECLLELPWAEQTEDNLDLDYARKVLDSNHYGMEKVKDRIIEYLAVQKLTSKPNGQILCFVGPPGVGKTSIVESIAKAMGRNFVRMSLGGIRDEAEIRGHRRTYIGAMPGRVISAMRQAGSTNPVLLFDEIDKLASDFRGDPAAAMLEVLDGAQNFAFRDHYLELPYDLSKAMLLTTANDEQTIPKPVLDRMEVIHVQSYLDCEKLQIAKRHLLAKQLEAHGLKKSNLRIADEEILAIINGYTREAGVRELERMLAAICRKAACQIAKGRKTITLTPKKRLEFLGKPRYHEDYKREKSEVGVVTGLAWTPAGGETLSIEAAVTKGSGIVQLTGHLGDVMQE